MLTEETESHRAARRPTTGPSRSAGSGSRAEEHRVWDLCSRARRRCSHGRAVGAFEEGLEVLDLVAARAFPISSELNARLFAAHRLDRGRGAGLVPDDVFFDHLSQRRFPAGNFIRSARAARLSRGAGRLPRRVRPCPVARQSGGRRFHAEARRARPRGDERARCTGSRGSTGTRSSSASPARTATLKIYGAGIVSSFGEIAFAREPRAEPAPVRSSGGAAHRLPPSTASSRPISSSTASKPCSTTCSATISRRSTASWTGPTWILRGTYLPRANSGGTAREAVVEGLRARIAPPPVRRSLIASATGRMELSSSAPPRPASASIS